jgi:transcription initiation factor TFIIIB Brf1 subunit/transcription initiation factor TFIIB
MCDDGAGTVRLFGRTLVTVALVQEEHHEKEHEHGGDVEWGKECLGTRLLESGFDTNLARHINDWRGWSSGEIHLLPKKDVFYTAKERAEENPNTMTMISIDELFSIAETCKAQDQPRENFIWTEYRCRFCPDDGTMVDHEGQLYTNGSRVANEDGLPTCVSCGHSDMAYISDEPEWNGGANDEGADPSRVGAPVNTTLFSASWGSGTIMSVQSSGTYANKRLARINFHTSMNHKDRALHHAYEGLDRVGRIVLGLPDSVMLQAKIMYRKFSESVLTRGAIRNGIKANCIMRACQDAHVARTTHEIAAAFNIPARDISRTADIFRETIPTVETTTTKSSDLVSRIFSQVTVPDDMRGRIRQRTIRMCEQVECHPSLMGKTPKGVTAAVLYTVLSDYGQTKESIAAMCDVSLPTLVKLENIVKKIVV